MKKKLFILIIIILSLVSCIDSQSIESESNVGENKPIELLSTNTPNPTSANLPPTLTTTPMETEVSITQTPDFNAIDRQVILLPDRKTEIALVYVPAGSFVMGTRGTEVISMEKPVHEVHLEGYWIGESEVTNTQFKAFVEATDYITTAEQESTGLVWFGSMVWDSVDGANWQHPHGPESNIVDKDTHPVVQVSWYDAVAFAEWAGLRLPSEPEWEKAARGIDIRKYPWGSPWLADYSNCDEVESDTTPINSYPNGISPYGAYDMAGNAWEWTADWFDRYPGNTTDYEGYGKPEGISAAYGQTHRVMRGGAWSSVDFHCRTSSRSRSLPSVRAMSIGFRIASDN